jgi:hypothetical protein
MFLSKAISPQFSHVKTIRMCTRGAEHTASIHVIKHDWQLAHRIPPQQGLLLTEKEIMATPGEKEHTNDNSWLTSWSQLHSLSPYVYKLQSTPSSVNAVLSLM